MRGEERERKDVGIFNKSGERRACISSHEPVFTEGSVSGDQFTLNHSADAAALAACKLSLAVAADADEKERSTFSTSRLPGEDYLQQPPGIHCLSLSLSRSSHAGNHRRESSMIPVPLADPSFNPPGDPVGKASPVIAGWREGRKEE